MKNVSFMGLRPHQDRQSGTKSWNHFVQTMGFENAEVANLGKSIEPKVSRDLSAHVLPQLFRDQSQGRLTRVWSFLVMCAIPLPFSKKASRLVSFQSLHPVGLDAHTYFHILSTVFPRTTAVFDCLSVCVPWKKHQTDGNMHKDEK